MYIKYKERSPEQTVKMARSILSQWGVRIKEEWHDSEVDLHSITLYIEGTDFSKARIKHILSPVHTER